MCAKPEAYSRPKLQDKQIGVFDRKTGGVSHSGVCVLGAVSLPRPTSPIVTVLWE